jgi:hypothetical protein
MKYFISRSEHGFERDAFGQGLLYRIEIGLDTEVQYRLNSLEGYRATSYLRISRVEGIYLLCYIIV